MKTIPFIKKVRVEGDALGFAQTARILQGLEGLPVKQVKPHASKAKPRSLDPEKDTLRLLCFQGSFLRPCPGTQGYICCGYQILQVGTNCPLDCSYCILQAYFNQPSLRLFVNLEHELGRIRRFVENQPERVFRIGTGEFTDSLALEPIAGWSRILLPFFSKRRNAVLELKTKTDRIAGLLSSEYRERTVVSWSLNSPHVSSREEKGAPGIEKRLEAAAQCQREGFTLGFHFDPLIAHPGWQEGYLRTIEMMDKYIDPKGIIWISLGALRYMPALKSIIRRRHPDTHVLDGEFVPGLDGKMRYFKPIRIAMYARIGEMLGNWHDDLGLYLCMEAHDVWEKSLGWSPGNTDGLSHFLDGRVLKMFG